MTTTDTLKLYADLHADVPETRPKELHSFKGGFWRWVSDDLSSKRGPYLPTSCVHHVCRSALLEWLCDVTKDTRNDYGERRWYAADVLRDWLDETGAKNDSRLIDICKAIHQAKGGEA